MTGEAIRTLGYVAWQWAWSIAPDSKCILWADRDGTVKLSNLETGEETLAWWPRGSIRVLSWSPDGGRVVYGTEQGEVGIVAFESLIPGPLVVTPFKGDERAHVGCPLCRTWFETSSAESLVSCRRCGGSLKLNPFTVDADWRPIAKAWRGYEQQG